MAERAKKAPGIADYRVSLRKRKVTFLDEIDRIIDWKPLERLLNKRLKRQPDAVGNPAYPGCSYSRFCRFSFGTTWATRLLGRN